MFVKSKCPKLTHNYANRQFNIFIQALLLNLDKNLKKKHVGIQFCLSNKE